MLLIQQQSSTFRFWTSRALMMYIRRALIFLVLNQRQIRSHQTFQSSQNVYFSDAEDDEDVIITNENQHLSYQCYSVEEDSMISKSYELFDIVDKTLSSPSVCFDRFKMLDVLLNFIFRNVNQ